MTPQRSQLKAPRHLKPATRRWWVQVVARWVLEEHHIRLLTRAAEAWDRGDQARQQIDREGLTTSTREGGAKLHPAVRVESDCRLAFARLIRELQISTWNRQRKRAARRRFGRLDEGLTMPRKLRSPKARREIALTPEEFERRARWGGVPGVPELTATERAEWRAQQEASSAWVPRSALAFAWANVDPMHGAREWTWAGFAAALEADRTEIARVAAEHSEQAARLRDWAARLEALGLERDGDPDRRPGHYYEQLVALGHSGA